jgi:predicted nucleic acid-binding protein
VRDSPSWPTLAAGDRRLAALPSDDRIERKIPVPVRFRLRLRRHIDPHALVSRLSRHAKVVAERYRLRGYDSVHLASYLEIARRAGAAETQFSSFDERLNRAALAAVRAMARAGRR